jgi:hypothetical protein
MWGCGSSVVKSTGCHAAVLGLMRLIRSSPTVSLGAAGLLTVYKTILKIIYQRRGYLPRMFSLLGFYVDQIE